MKKVTYLFLLAAALGACTPKPSNKVEIIQPAAFVSIFPKGNAIEGTNFMGLCHHGLRRCPRNLSALQR